MHLIKNVRALFILKTHHEGNMWWIQAGCTSKVCIRSWTLSLHILMQKAGSLTCCSEHLTACSGCETGGEMPSWGALAGRISLGVVMLVMQCCTGVQLWLLLCSLPAVRGTQGYVALSWVIYSLSSKCVLGVGGSCNEIKCSAQETCSGTEN